MHDHYVVEVYKHAAFTERGVDHYSQQTELVSATPATSWQHCLELVAALAQAHPEHIVAACNAARGEPDTDGLTDSEREEMLSAVERARAVIGEVGR